MKNFSSSLMVFRPRIIIIIIMHPATPNETKKKCTLFIPNTLKKRYSVPWEYLEFAADCCLFIGLCGPQEIGNWALGRKLLVCFLLLWHPWIIIIEAQGASVTVRIIYSFSLRYSESYSSLNKSLSDFVMQDCLWPTERPDRTIHNFQFRGSANSM